MNTNLRPNHRMMGAVSRGLIVLLLVAGAVALAASLVLRNYAKPADQGKPGWCDAVDGLQTRITVSRSDHPSAQVIWVAVDVRNVSDEPVEMAWMWNFGSMLNVTRAGGVKLRPSAAAPLPEKRDATVVLQPAQQINAFYCWLNRDFDLTTPGEYSVQWTAPADAQEYVAKGRIPPLSNVVSFTLGPGEGATEKPTTWAVDGEWSPTFSRTPAGSPTENDTGRQADDG